MCQNKQQYISRLKTCSTHSTHLRLGGLREGEVGLALRRGGLSLRSLRERLGGESEGLRRRRGGE
jgi:hypothetical protein